MEKFIKVNLVGLGWDQSTFFKNKDSKDIANLLALLLERNGPFDATPTANRNISISVCDQVDNIHFLETDQALIVPI